MQGTVVKCTSDLIEKGESSLGEGLFLLVGILILIVSWIAGLLATPFGLASSIVSGIITALIQPILPVALVFLYYSMIARESEQTAAT